MFLSNRSSFGTLLTEEGFKDLSEIIEKQKLVDVVEPTEPSVQQESLPSITMKGEIFNIIEYVDLLSVCSEG